jgi:hypothetical protein
VKLHLFVRKFEEIEGITQPFMYLGEVFTYKDTVKNNKPIMMEFGLRNPVPEDIYRDFNAIYVHSAVVLDHKNNWIHKKYTKNGQSTRQVIYSKEVIDLIGQGTGRIFKCTPDYLTSSFCNLRDRLGLKCRFHDLRHYTISTMHAIGIPDQYIQQRSGHKTDKTMKDVYRNPLKSQSNVFVARINDYFSKNFKDELKPENENQIIS